MHHYGFGSEIPDWHMNLIQSYKQHVHSFLLFDHQRQHYPRCMDRLNIKKPNVTRHSTCWYRTSGMHQMLFGGHEVLTILRIDRMLGMSSSCVVESTCDHHRDSTKISW